MTMLGFTQPEALLSPAGQVNECAAQAISRISRIFRSLSREATRDATVLVLSSAERLPAGKEEAKLIAREREIYE
jgi:hypothetical protein